MFEQFASETLFDLSPDAILVTDAEGIIRAANPRTAELFGYPLAELIGLPVESLVPERFRGRHPSHERDRGVAPGLEVEKSEQLVGREIVELFGQVAQAADELQILEGGEVGIDVCLLWDIAKGGAISL